jgi:hypothetical protein
LQPKAGKDGPQGGFYAPPPKSPTPGLYGRQAHYQATFITALGQAFRVNQAACYLYNPVKYSDKDGPLRITVRAIFWAKSPVRTFQPGDKLFIIHAMKHYDVIVVGQGPGGAAAAYEMARQGMNVLALAGQTKHKPCGGCLSVRWRFLFDYLGAPEWLWRHPVDNLLLAAPGQKNRGLAHPTPRGLLCGAPSARRLAH